MIVKILRCEVCNTILDGSKKTNCGSKKCKATIARRRYKKRRENKLLKRPCPCCGKIIPNTEDKYCSDMCLVRCDGISPSEERYINTHKYNIVKLASLARLLPENRKRLREIEDRLRRKYSARYHFSLPMNTLLKEFGFTEDLDVMSYDLYLNGMLTGSSYQEVAYDLSIYRKLFDYGIILGFIE